MAFIAKVQADASLQEKLKAKGADPVAVAKAVGFSITTEDLNAHKVELSDDELEGAAGGATLTQEVTCVLRTHVGQPACATANVGKTC